MATYIPFNHNPASRDIKTAAYTIPAGQYAFVHFLSYDSDCTIDSDVIIPTLSISTAIDLSGTGDAAAIYTPSTGYNFKGQLMVYNSAAAAGKRYGFYLLKSAVKYYFSKVDVTSATAYQSVNSFQSTPAGAITSSASIPGIQDLTIPSGTTLEYDNIATSTVTLRMMLCGILETPLGVQNYFHVPSGIEVDATKFEVILFNEA